jgi:hypothetical protein
MSFGGGTAIADTSGDGSIGGGNQVNLPISLPIDISGNSVAAVGESTASSRGGASVVDTGRGGGIPNETSGNHSVLGGNQVNAPISAPINACGNAVSLVGSSDAGCTGGATVRKSGKGGAGGNRTSGDHSVLGGNQITAPISAPINACGNAVAIFGDSTAGCKGGSSVRDTGPGAGGNRTSGRSSVLGGNQVIAPISAPINICGNSVAAFGQAFSGCKGGSSVTNGGGRGYQSAHHHHGSTGNDTDGRFGAGSGNQVIAPISLPITACGNAVGNAQAGCAGGASVHNSKSGSGAGGNRTSGRSGVLAGNQVVAPVTAPVNVCGNAVALLGDAFAGCKGGASVKNGGKGAGGNTTSGRSGVASGNQVVAPITAPVNACGNAVAVLGDAAAGCLGGANVGRPPHDGGYTPYVWHVSKTSQAGTSGALPALPALPALSGVQEVGTMAQQMSGSGLPPLPVVGDVAGQAGLPKLPALPGLPGEPKTPPTAKKPSGGAAFGPSAGKRPRPAASGPASALAPATSLVGSTPVGGAVSSATGGLPTSGLGLMSAAQPMGVTGMNTGALFALVLGGMLAASATLFATTRRFRLGRK